MDFSSYTILPFSRWEIEGGVYDLTKVLRVLPTRFPRYLS